MPTNPWRALELIPAQSALPRTWQRLLNEHLPAFKILCLQQTTGPGGLIPCPRNCGCRHRIIPRHDRTGAIAICRCLPATNCPDIPMTLEEATPLQLNRPRLARAICKALDCQLKLTDLKPEATLQLGSWSAESVPIILTLQTDPSALRTVIPGLSFRLARPFILFAPTSAHLDAECQELLAHAKAGFFTLDTTLQLTEHGTLLPLRPPGELFAQFTPQPQEPIAQAAAVQAIALIKTLDSQHPVRKAPVATVFRLYCLHALSPPEIARKCDCTVGLIFIRLRWLRLKLGRNPAELRQFASHLQAIDASLSDPRARRINRHSAIYGSDDEIPPTD